MIPLPLPALVLGTLGLCALWLVGCFWAPASAPVAVHAFRLQLAPQTLRADEATVIWDKPAGAGPGLH